MVKSATVPVAGPLKDGVDAIAAVSILSRWFEVGQNLEDRMDSTPQNLQMLLLSDF